MNDKQIDKATKWYALHREHVNDLIGSMSNKNTYIMPTDILDKNDPSLWKDRHWNWFLNFRKV